MKWIETIKIWFNGDELQRYWILQLIQRDYFIKHQVKINKQYSKKLFEDAKIKNKSFKSEDHWTYIPSGSQYEN